MPKDDGVIRAVERILTKQVVDKLLEDVLRCVCRSRSRPNWIIDEEAWQAISHAQWCDIARWRRR